MVLVHTPLVHCTPAKMHQIAVEASTKWLWCRSVGLSPLPLLSSHALSNFNQITLFFLPPSPLSTPLSWSKLLKCQIDTAMLQEELCWMNLWHFLFTVRASQVGWFQFWFMTKVYIFSYFTFGLNLLPAGSEDGNFYLAENSLPSHWASTTSLMRKVMIKMTTI